MASQEEWRRRAYDEWVGRTTGARSNIDQARGDDLRRAEQRRNNWTPNIPSPVETNAGSNRATGTQTGGSGLLAIIIVIGLIIAFGGSDESSSTTPSARPPEPQRRTVMPDTRPLIPEQRIPAPRAESAVPAGSTQTSPRSRTSVESPQTGQSVIPPFQSSPAVPRPDAPQTQRSVTPPAAPQQLILRPTYKTQPAYPALARQARMSGAVLLSVWVAPNGTVQRIDGLSGNPILVRAASDAVRQWRYEPYPAEYGPLASTEVIVNFNLK